MRITEITDKIIDEAVNPEDIDLSSFKVKDQLNPKIFDKNQKIHPEIKTRLIMIADDFFDTLELPWVDVTDITLTGSLANYNWSKFSDVDLHILIDYNEVDDNESLVSEYLAAKKNIWNEKHDIKIKGYDVELYVQDMNEDHVSTGVYSIMWDDWLVKPERGTPKIDYKKVKQKASSIIDSYDSLIQSYYQGDYDKVIRRINTTRQKIKKMRQAGLDREGEYSYENITFKVLRRVGLLDKLSDLETMAYDKSLSM
jgi:hypothetical protein